jgi:hypothetical protein
VVVVVVVDVVLVLVDVVVADAGSGQLSDLMTPSINDRRAGESATRTRSKELHAVVLTADAGAVVATGGTATAGVSTWAGGPGDSIGGGPEGSAAASPPATTTAAAIRGRAHRTRRERSENESCSDAAPVFRVFRPERGAWASPPRRNAAMTRRKPPSPDLMSRRSPVDGPPWIEARTEFGKLPVHRRDGKRGRAKLSDLAQGARTGGLQPLSRRLPRRPSSVGTEGLALTFGGYLCRSVLDDPSDEPDVVHGKFGEGVILEIIGEGDKAEAVVRFPSVGEKRFLLAWTPLKRA